MSEWWASLRHGGLLISPSRLQKYFSEQPGPLDDRTIERLRAALTRLENTPDDADTRKLWLSVTFESVCGLTSGWTRGAQIDAQWSRRAATGEAIRPRQLWQGPHRALLPVFVDEEPRLGIGRSRRAGSRVVEWLRAGESRLAIITNYQQLRLIYAGLDYDAWTEWDTELWFEGGQPSAQVDALRRLLAPGALIPPEADASSRLLAAIEESRRGQSELSSALGERVRQAVELLIQTHGAALAAIGERVSKRHIYIAATRMVMRVIIILFAESRELLPRDSPVYHNSYGIQGLRDALERAGSGGARARLRERSSAWPRIVGLCRLIYEGSHHPDLPIPHYGGRLFEPGSPDALDPVARAIAVFENPADAPNDADVATILSLLAKTEMRVRQGGASRVVAAPVDFGDLSSEYIGILYEGLLDYELRQAGDDAVVFLRVGDEPALPLSRLEDMTDEQLKPLVEKLKVKTRLAAGDDDDSQDGDEEDESVHDDNLSDEEQVADLVVEELAAEAVAYEDALEDADETLTDVQEDARLRARLWATRAVVAGGLVAKLRSRRPEAVAAYDAEVEARAQALVSRVVVPGEWYLVRWGGTRKGAGTFYTRPQLAVPTVQRTLRPLAYDAPDSNADASPSAWTPKEPGQLLALKVCDPAIGSGSFAVAALRFLTEALWRSVLHHGWIVERDGRLVVTNDGVQRPPWFAECVRDLPLDAADPESLIRPRFKRVVVEHCIYGVDLDPLAIELARLALWVETMDRTLPFEFLDHKLKPGNALVGAWFDRVQDYPILAWIRKAGDEGHDRFVHHFREYIPKSGKSKGQKTKSGDLWAAALKEFRDIRVKPALLDWLVGQQSLFDAVDGQTPASLHDEALRLFEELHAMPLHEPDRRAAFYRDRIELSPALENLRDRFDTWCALWFWPANELEAAPLPTTFGHLSEDVRVIVCALRDEHRFFHWELEFPDVFAAQGSGFDAIVGNPPWEIQKQNSKEFFSNIDPLYRTYGKQDALAHQREYFERNSEVERSWVSYVARYKALSNWKTNVGSPFGDGADDGEEFGLGKRTGMLYVDWLRRRVTRRGYADSRHPFMSQGSADINTYKMFLEHAHSLVRAGGHLGIIVPAGVYSDKGSSRIRALFLNQCAWQWLFSFENRLNVFDIDSRFKFCVVIVRKGGRTDRFYAAFMRTELADWAVGEQYAISYTRSDVELFSPVNRFVAEITDQRDVQTMKLISQASGSRFGEGAEEWAIEYSRELDVTLHSHLFRSRDYLESQGFADDSYGSWRHGQEEALPLYEGRMVGQFDFSDKAWVSGAGRRAVWSTIPADSKRFAPQFLIMSNVVNDKSQVRHYAKFAIMRISSATNERTVISAFIPAFPAQHSLFTGRAHSGKDATLLLTAFLNSFVFDYFVRQMCAGVNVTGAILDECPLPSYSSIPTRVKTFLTRSVARLTLIHRRFAPEWLQFRPATDPGAFARSFALTLAERTRLRAISDALVAELYGLTYDDLKWILRECDRPASQLCSIPYTRKLNQKGFWRVDKDREPELRHPILTLIAFNELKEMIAAYGSREAGIAAFCDRNDGEGWKLPETLRLADYDMGHDERAAVSQPVAASLGATFLPWQLEMSVEESWTECERNARTLLGEEGYARLKAEFGFESDYPPATRTHAKAVEAPSVAHRTQSTLFPKVDE